MGQEVPPLGRLLTAMITPFREDGTVDYAAAQQLARQLCEDGSDGIVVAGTTGESPTLSDDEKVALIRAVREAIPGRSLVAGTGTYDTRHSVELSERAMAAGADALLCVVPYYNKPPQEGMYRHFRELARVGPVIMYNIQSRTGVNMSAETTLRCAAEPGVIGVKEASGNIDQMGFVCAGAPPGFRVWSGDDSFTLPLLAVGGYGVICVVSHLAGSAMKRMIEAHLAGRNDEARSIHHRLLPLIKALMTVSSNPVPVKSALNALGFPAGPFRLPLTPLPRADLDRVLEAVRAAGDLVTFRGGARVG
ncbi:MAG TPA: 4-hydroxy-tetrahydrodipicolinate synthase [Candidatus Dormibacteraeota bacterium]|jgi:4-hydroxy-tetrahydrodipicolinate synthase|nr:4-hydroxy-tetrahydrodipicolinate synthase [Candidatus Dormibacteraeota bacterium]